jgi:SOS-response transcriptional repressor LexA
MTPQEKACLDAIVRLSADGVSPTYDELRAALGLASKSGVARLVDALEAQGFVRRGKGGARNLEVLKVPDLVAHLRQLARTHGKSVLISAVVEACGPMTVADACT